jgi:hypothetical protein
MLSVESPGVDVDSFEIRCKHHRFMSRARLELSYIINGRRVGRRCKVAVKL